MEHLHRVGHGQSAAVGELEGHAARHARRPAAAFGEEVEPPPGIFSHDPRARLSERSALVGFGLGQEELRGVRFRSPLPGAQRVGIGVEHGDYAGEAGFFAPIHHFARVGPHLVVARANGELQGEAARGRAQAVEAQGMEGHLLAVGPEQLHVEHAAERRGSQRGGAHDVGFVPKRVALEVGGVVEVEVDFFARKGVVKARGGLELVEECLHVGLLGQSGVEEQGEEEEDAVMFHAAGRIDVGGLAAKVGIIPRINN